MTDTIYHMPESKTEEALKVYLSNVSSLSNSANIITKFSDVINDESNKDKTTVTIIATDCEPDEDYLGNWTVKASVMIMTPIQLSNGGTNIYQHDLIAGTVTDRLSTLLNDGAENLSNVSAGLTVDFFKFGNRKQNVDGDYIVTDQSVELLIKPS